MAVVERGTFADQRTVTGTLADIAARARAAGVRAPAITVVGPVAALHDELAWFAAGPLRGLQRRRHARAGAGQRARRAGCVALGAHVVEAPAIRIEPLEAALPADLAAYDLLCVTSPNGARRLLEIARDARALAGPAIAAIGPGTADALRAGGIEPDIVPPRAVAESLVEALAERPRDARADRARRAGARRAARRAARARRRRSRSSRCTAPSPSRCRRRALESALGADYVTFTSASAVRFFLEAAGEPSDGQRIVSIGPITSAALRERGLTVDVEASEHTPDGLIAALLADVAPALTLRQAGVSPRCRCRPRGSRAARARPPRRRAGRRVGTSSSPLPSSGSPVGASGSPGLRRRS